MTSRSDVSRALPVRDADSHKRSRGSVAILGGSKGMSGAAILAAEGAMRAGAGYVTVGITEGVQPIVASAVPEVLTRVLSRDQTLGPGALDEFKPVLERATALAVGPGLGQGDGQRDLVLYALRTIDMPIVLDADGLNVLVGATAVVSEREAPLVITPHPAELARLMETEIGTIQADRVAAVTNASAALGCVVVLKGFRSLVASEGKLIVNPTGGPSLASAGTGDVLTGVIATFLAQGLDPFDAAVAGVYVHGLAGDLCEEEGAVAGDIARALPEAVALVRSSEPAR